MWELDRTFAILAEAGFDEAELMVTKDPRTQSVEACRKLADKEGIRVSAVHAPMLVLTRRIWGPAFLPIIERSVELAKGLGSDVVVVHPPYLWELKYQTWLISQLDRFSADSGIAIGVENMFRLWVNGRPIRGHRWVSPSDLEGFTQITLDTSHCGVDGYDILEALERVGPQTAHIHLSDSHGNHRDNHALPGEGVLPLREFLSLVPSSGFAGAISLELDMRQFASERPKAIDALRRARDFCLEHLG